jgi:hypothetical protein
VGAKGDAKAIKKWVRAAGAIRESSEGPKLLELEVISEAISGQKRKMASEQPLQSQCQRIYGISMPKDTNRR